MEEKSQKSIKKEIRTMRKAAKGVSNYCSSSIRKTPKCESDISDMLYGIWTEDKKMQLFAIESLNFAACILGNIDLIIKSPGVVHRFVEFLKKDDSQLQSAAAGILACIAAENANIVIQHGALPILVNLIIFSTHDDVREQVLWVLGNLAPKSRHFVLRALIPFVCNLNEQASCSIFKNAAYALSNFCGKTPKLDVLPALSRLIYLTDENVLANTCWTLSQLVCGIDDITEHATISEILPRVVQLLEHSSPSIIISALRTVGNIVARSQSQTQAIIDFGALISLGNLLKGKYSQSIKKTACWTISNIIAENKENITQTVFDAGITSWLVTRFATKFRTLYKLVLKDCVMALCRLFLCYDPRIVEVCLEGLHNMVKSGPSDLVLRKIEAYDGIVNIMQLREIHSDPYVRQKANMFLDSNWKCTLVDYDFVDDDKRSSPPRSTLTGAKRIDPCPPPFPIIPNERLHPGLDIRRLKESEDVRVVNAYFDETRPIKRRLKLEDTSLIQDVRFRYYHGHLVFEGCPMGIMNLVNDLSEPKVIQIDLNQNNSQILRIISEMGVPDGEDVVRESRMLMDLLKNSNGLASIDVYDFGMIDLSDECSLVRNKISTKLKSLLLQ